MHSFLYDGHRYSLHRDKFPVYNQVMDLLGVGPSSNNRWPDNVVAQLSSLADHASATQR
jgi:hypothetical protein